MNQSTFDEQFVRFEQMSRADGRFVPKSDFPCLSDDTPEQGYDPHYVIHTGWAARKLAESKPIIHHDFGASLYFASIVSAFITLYYHDIRNPNLPFRDVTFTSENLTNLSFKDESLYSLSALHCLEHVGLARYGDELDAKGDRKAAKELMRVLAPGGELLIVVPMEDPPRCQFNAHRLYSYENVMELFYGVALAEFSLITNSSEFFPYCNPSKMKGQTYACGCFRFIKL
jgi:SAM-dependent methyltransferase